MDWITRDRLSVWHPFDWAGADFPVIERAQGVWLYADDGKRYLDAISSWWVNLHGHAHPQIAEAIAQQAKQLEHVIFSGFTHRSGIELAERLLAASGVGQGKVFYSDNGSTAVEVALKMAFQYWHIQSEKRTRVVAFEGAYHGDTFGAMSVGGRGTFSVPFEPLMFDVDLIPFPKSGEEQATIDAMMRLCTDQTACFIFEPLVQGAAGMRMYSSDVLDRLMSIALRAGALCIADEVMTGFGRTGTFLATHQCRMKPDLICLSKGITGGFMPLGATLCTDRIFNAFDADNAPLDRMFLHGHSYTGNPLACAAALASLDITLSTETTGALARIEVAHRNFAQSLDLDQHAVTDVRVLGTILAVEYSGTGGYADDIRHRLYRHHLEQGIVLRPLGNVCYVLPPYCIANNELEMVYTSINQFHP